MKPVPGQKGHEDQKPDVLDVTAEIYAWLEIVVATLIVGLILGLGVYFSMPGKTGRVLGIAIIVASLIVGIILATKARKKKRSLR